MHINTIKDQIEMRQAKKNDHAVILKPAQGNFGLHYNYGGKLVINDTDNNVREISLTDTARKQISDDLNIPADFFFSDALTETERQIVFNRVAHKSPLTRVFRLEGNTAYGVVSSRYTPIDNNRMVEILGGVSYDLAVLGGTNIYNPDHSILKISKEKSGLQVGAHIPMITITNSENGMGSFTLAAGVYTLACTNGMVIPLTGFNVKSRLIHIGDNDMNLPDLETVWNIAAASAKMMDRAEGVYLTPAHKDRMIQIAKREMLTNRMVDRAIEYGNTEYHGFRSLSDMVGSFTAMAQEYSDTPETRTKIETASGKMMLDMARKFKIAA